MSIKFLLSTTLAALLLPLPALAQVQTAPVTPPTPPATTDRYVWDLTPLFATDAAWDTERQAVLAEIPGLAAYKGTLGQSASALQKAMDTASAL